MRNTEKDQNWREMIRKQGELRHFGSMAIRKSSKGDMVSKTIISRLIDSLEKKGLIVKERTQTDRRSYGVSVTEAGKEEVDRMYYYYMDPLYILREQMETEDFEKLFSLIEKANIILNKTNCR